MNPFQSALREFESSFREKFLNEFEYVIFKPKINAENYLSDVISRSSFSTMIQPRFSSQINFASIKMNFLSENLPQCNKSTVQFFVKSLDEYMTAERNNKYREDDKKSKQIVNDSNAPSNEAIRLIELEGNKLREYYFSGKNGEILKEKKLRESRKLSQRLKDELMKMFFPLDYPHSVSEGFSLYSKFRAVQHISSSILAVLSTQSLLIAAGLNPSPFQSTVVSWVLKDGCQHIGKFICSNFGTKMDAEPKKWRIMADCMYDFGAGLDVLSPFFANNFLFIAGLANLAKGMALVSARATRLPIYSSFAKQNNLSDLYTKGEAISVFSNGLGLLIGIQLTKSVCLSAKNKLMLFPVLSFIHLFCVANEMRSVPLNTLNKERTKILIQDYLKTGKVCTPGEVRYKENYFFVPQFLDPTSKNVQTGASISKIVQRADFVAMAQKFRNEKFMLLHGSDGSDLVLHRSADGRDAIRAFLLSACIDQMLGQTQPNVGSTNIRDGSGSEIRSCGESQASSSAMSFGDQVSLASAAKLRGDWFGTHAKVGLLQKNFSNAGNSSRLLDEAFDKMEKLFPGFVRDLEKRGWLTHLFLDSSGARVDW